MAKHCVIGSGYLAKHLKEKLVDYSWYPTEDTEVIFYVSGPTHMDFNRNPSYFYIEEKNKILNLVRSGCKIVYASSALVYEETNAFTEMKREIEDVVLTNYGVVARIFPVFGYETKTFIGQAIKDMKQNKRPTVYGDGTQTRDFVFIEDVANEMINLAKKDNGIYDIGNGHPVSFNEVIFILNKILGTNLEPNYIESPRGYVKEGVKCNQTLLVNTPLEEALKLCVQ